MSNLIKFLSLTIFIVAIWGINIFLLPRISNETKNINIAKRELAIKQSFNDNSPIDISKSVNEFVLKKFDKNQLVNNIDSLAQKSGIKISTLDIQINNSNKLIEKSNLDSEVIDKDLPLSQTDVGNPKTNNLKSVSLKIDIKGDKISVDSFLSELVNFRQYIDIQSINFSYSLNSDSIATQVLDSTIIATIYYINL